MYRVLESIKLYLRGRPKKIKSSLLERRTENVLNYNFILYRPKEKFARKNIE